MTFYKSPICYDILHSLWYAKKISRMSANPKKGKFSAFYVKCKSKNGIPASAGTCFWYKSSYARGLTNMETIKLLSPAKINLFLEVLGKRPDGYHNIDTLFAKVAVFDKLTVTKYKSKNKLNIKIINNCGCKMPSAKNNIISKAVEKFKEEFGFDSGLDITLEKNIPIGAGLGGGSSDAATTLTALCKLSGNISNPARNKRLAKIASQLGADVPFFLYHDTFCTAKSVGDDLFPLHVKQMPVYVLILYPGFSVSTKSVYEKLKYPCEKEILTKLDMLNKLKSDLKTGLSLAKWKKHMFNRLESVVMPFDKKLSNIHKKLSQLSGGAAMMCGSGSSIFVLTQDEQKAKFIAKSFEKKVKIVFETCFLWRKRSYENN